MAGSWYYPLLSRASSASEGSRPCRCVPVARFSRLWAPIACLRSRPECWRSRPLPPRQVEPGKRPSPALRAALAGRQGRRWTLAVHPLFAVSRAAWSGCPISSNAGGAAALGCFRTHVRESPPREKWGPARADFEGPGGLVPPAWRGLPKFLCHSERAAGRVHGLVVALEWHWSPWRELGPAGARAEAPALARLLDRNFGGHFGPQAVRNAWSLGRLI